MSARKRKKKISLPVIVVSLGIVMLCHFSGIGTTEEKTQAEMPKTELPREEKISTSPQKTDNLLLPAYLTDRAEEILWREGFVISYNSKHLLPNWVSWLLTKERTKGTEKRADNFQPDEEIKQGPIAYDNDYKASGFDRGHMCPAADCKHSRASQNQCFLMSNICPQTHALNAGDWKELEELTRKWAQTYDSLYIVCGPVIERDKVYPTIGNNKVSVPERYFKVIWRNVSGQRAEAIGFIFENNDKNQPLSEYAMTVDEVEKCTGINFFSKFPKDLERKAESSFDAKAWKGLK